MELQDLINITRQRCDDTVTPYFCDDETLTKFAVEAENEACVRSRLLFDDSSDFLTIAVGVGESKYTLDERVQVIDQADFKLTSGGKACDLDLRGIDYVREQNSEWKTETGTPYVLVHKEKSQLLLWPIPSAVGTLTLSVYRKPIYDMEDMSDEPEISTDHHEGLVDWMLYRFFTTKDSEMYDEAKAAKAEKDFIARFGERPSSDVLRRHREKRRVTTRYGGY